MEDADEASDGRLAFLEGQRLIERGEGDERRTSHDRQERVIVNVQLARLLGDQRTRNVVLTLIALILALQQRGLIAPELRRERLQRGGAIAKDEVLRTAKLDESYGGAA